MAATLSGLGVLGPGRPEAATAVTLPPTVEAWVYPGVAGGPTCDAAGELSALAASPIGVVKPEYLTVGARGRVLTETDATLPCNGYGPAGLAEVRAAAQRVFVTVSAGRSGVKGLLSSPSRRGAGEAAIERFVSANALDGVDLDFEPGRWTSTTWSRYMAFVADVVAALAPAGRGVEVDLGAFTTTPWDAERYGDVSGAGARVVVMAYDHEYDVACAPISPSDWLARVVGYAQSQMPSGSLAIGLPAYGYTATTCSRVAGIRSNVAYVTMAQQPGFPATAAARAAVRDPGSGELRWSSGGTFYDVVDASALDAKLQLVESLGVGDVSVWSLGGEPWFSGDPG